MNDARRLRILLVSVAIEGDGAEQVVADLATGLIRAGHTVAIAFLEGTDTRVPSLREAGVECHRLLPRQQFASSAVADFTPSCITRLRRVVRDFRPDVIHAHVPRATLWMALTKRPFRLRVPFVYSEHSTQSVYPSWARWVYGVLLPGVNHVASVSEAAGRSFRGRWGWDEGRATPIWNGIDPGRLVASKGAEAVGAELGCASHTPAVSLLHERLPAARCWVAGSPHIDYAAADVTRQCLASAL